jgi:hypothetical protein
MNKYDSIPAGACTFAAPIEVGSNGEGSKTAPFNILARSSKPIEHWFWGNVVHDSAGAFGKDRIPIDYNHDEVIGFANKREVTSEGVRLSGALVSVAENDRADTVMKQAQAGIPFEASINFGGDGIKIEEVAAGATAFVNGYDFAGPGVIIREYPLRGCAFCPYGADGNTETELFSEGTKFSAQLVTQKPEVAEMSKPEQADATEAKPAVELAQVEAVEAIETAPAEAVQAVEEDVAELAQADVEAPEAEAEVVEPVQFSQDELVKMTTDFGQDITMQVVTNGGNYADAKELHQASKDAELEALRAEVAELKAQKPIASGASPVAFADGEKRKSKMSFVQGLTAKLNGNK